MKKFIVTFGNDAWEDTITIWDRSKASARKTVEAELRKGVRIFKIEESWKKN